MPLEINIKLFGSLSLSRAKENRTSLSINAPVGEPSPLADVLSDYGIPIDQVQLVMLNYKASSLNVTIRPGDRVALFPREYPIFADWSGYRNDWPGQDKQLSALK